MLLVDFGMIAFCVVLISCSGGFSVCFGAWGCLLLVYLLFIFIVSVCLFCCWLLMVFVIVVFALLCCCSLVI